MSKLGADPAHAAHGRVRTRKRSTHPNPVRRLAAAVVALALGAGFALVGVAAPASAHTGDLKANAVCNPQTGEYDVTYTLKLSDVPRGNTGTTMWRIGGDAFEKTPTNAGGMDRGPLRSEGNTTITLGTESLPGDTVGNGPWVYAYTSWSPDGFGKGSDGRIEKLKGDCGNPDEITFCHATSSDTNPFTHNTTSVRAFMNAGHIDHEGDIWPAFAYVDNKGVSHDVAAQGDQRRLTTGDCSKPLTEVPVPTATFADECGVDNYVLQYDAGLEGVVWSKSIVDGKLTLTATADEDYVFANGKTTSVFGPWALNQDACDEVVPAPTEASFDDACGVDNYVLSYDAELEGVVWAKSIVDGVLTLTATPAEGYVFAGDRQQVVFGPWTLDQSACDEEIAAPIASFTDTCGVDNYVLSYDAELEGVVWTESIVDGVLTLTAMPAEGYVFAGDEQRVVFGPWTLDESACDVVVTVPTQAAFADACGVDNESIAYDTTLEGVVWAESVVDGKLTLTATPAEGYVFAGDRQQVVFGPWSINDAPCTEPNLDGSVATGTCIADAPWIFFDITLTDPDRQSTTRDASLVLSDGEHTETLALGTIGDSGELEGKVLWPGASVDDEGNANGWPGWEQLEDGTWAETDGNFAWTRDLTSADLVVNPELTVALTYPPATPDCAAAPPETETPGEPGDGDDPAGPAASGEQGLAETGFAGTSIAIVAGVIVLAGVAFVVVARLRRKQA